MFDLETAAHVVSNEGETRLDEISGLLQDNARHFARFGGTLGILQKF